MISYSKFSVFLVFPSLFRSCCFFPEGTFLSLRLYFRLFNARVRNMDPCQPDEFRAIIRKLSTWNSFFDLFEQLLQSLVDIFRIQLRQGYMYPVNQRNYASFIPVLGLHLIIQYTIPKNIFYLGVIYLCFIVYLTKD